MFRYPDRLAHQTPAWVESGATYHIRIRIERDCSQSLTDAKAGTALLDSARFYHVRWRWHCRLFLLMPDQLHALLTFPNDKAMGTVVAAWKGYQAKHLGIHWQGNYFDHRIRDHRELGAKADYIRLNPLRKNLCVLEEAWPWVLSCV